MGTDIVVGILVVVVAYLIVRIGRLNQSFEESRRENLELRKQLDVRDNVDDEEENDEELHEQGKLAQLINAKCKYASNHTDVLKNPEENDVERVEYERSQYEKMKKTVMDHLKEIDDEFYRGFAAHSIIRLLISGNDIDEAKTLFAEIEDKFIREKITEEFAEILN